MADKALLNRMARMMTSKTDEALTDVFRISYNTWRKLDRGQPVRTSLLARLEERVSFLEAANDSAIER